MLWNLWNALGTSIFDTERENILEYKFNRLSTSLWAKIPLEQYIGRLTANESMVHLFPEIVLWGVAVGVLDSISDKVSWLLLLICHILGAAYTYCKSLCQKESLHRCGIVTERKKTRRQCERISQVNENCWVYFRGFYPTPLPIGFPCILYGVALGFRFAPSWHLSQCICPLLSKIQKLTLNWSRCSRC